MELPLGFHLLIVDDNSPDGTAGLVTNLQPKYPGRLHLVQRAGKVGIGHRLHLQVSGLAWTTAMTTRLKWMQTSPMIQKTFPWLQEACEKQGADLSIGSRYVTGVNVVNWPRAVYCSPGLRASMYN